MQKDIGLFIPKGSNRIGISRESADTHFYSPLQSTAAYGNWIDKCRGVSLQKLKGILPTALVTLGAAGIIQLFSKYFSKGELASEDTFMVAQSAVMEKTADEVAPQALRATAESMQQAAPITAEKVYLIPQNIALWFLVGALFALAVYFVWSWVRNKRN